MIELKTILNWKDEVIDKVTGFKGKVVAVTMYEHGCVRIGVKPQINNPGVMPETEWFDESDLINDKDVVLKKPGGPMPNPKMQSNSKRY